MKTLSTLILAAFLAAPMVQAQTPPQAISYQALVRDGAGQPVRIQQVGVRIGLILDSATASPVYVERHTPTTNNFGNINLAIGRGALVSGSASNLDLTRPLYINIAVDIAGGTSYTDLGTAQALSVPYALYAQRSGSSVSSPVQSEIRDADSNTRVSTERNANENMIRFDINGTERMRLQANRLEFLNTTYSVHIGNLAGAASTAAANENTFVGQEAGRQNTSGTSNTFVGALSGNVNTTGTGNTFVGGESGSANTIGNGNTFYGNRTGWSNVSGSQNTFLGNDAGAFNTASYNTFFGSQSGRANTSGSGNVFMGFSTGRTNTTGGGNIFIGAYAGDVNTNGQDNIFLGGQAGTTNSTGNANIFIGGLAGQSNVSGIRNVYIGSQAGSATTGSGNIFIGYQAGYLETGSDRLYLDNSNTVTPLVFGNFATNSATINGNLTVTGTFSNPSDRRLKENVRPITGALDGVAQLQGVRYEWKPRLNPENIRGQGRQIGVIAQDVEKVYPELVTATTDGYKAVDYPKLTAVLIEAVKELKKQNAELMAWKEKVDATLRLSGAEREAAKVAKR